MNLKTKAQAFVLGHRKLWAQIACIACVVALLYGGYRMVAYTVPLYSGDPYSAAQASVGDKANALYDAGLKAYQAGNYDLAKDLFTAGYSELTDKTGTIPEKRQSLASDFQFELGNLLVKSNKKDDAVEAYKQSLRHNPNNLAAKYNLELLMQPPMGGGQGDGQGQGNGQGDGPPKPGDGKPGQPGQGDPGKKPSPGGGHNPKKGI